ncbi:MAG: zinc ribbon domain-containing protein [Bacteroidales bacterium]|nr:zinc ribbon domain-containing protein [Bacteroidales bacterium]MCD8393344.1 zinc ribbon domain-containing protein [Bacteroidales bacterium]
MLRGITTFRCHECGHRFEAPDIEWQATALTTPQPCPRCGSRHTRPASSFWLTPAYKSIWKQLDQPK